MKKFKLSRTCSHRKALYCALAKELFKYGKIITTVSKAKAVQGFVEKLITKAKENNLHKRRQVLSYIKDESVVKKLFDTIAPRFKERYGGYTRIIKARAREGDNAQLAIIELIE